MEQLTYLEQFKLEIPKLIFENVNELSKVVDFNTPTYKDIIRFLLDEVIKEAEAQNREDIYLIEIRELWKLHIFFLDSVRFIYDHLKFKKLPHPKEFIDRKLPAYIELKGSVTPPNNALIIFDENQNLYWQYLEFAKILEGAMIVIEFHLSEKLDVKTNFEQIKEANSEELNHDCKIGREFMIGLEYKEGAVTLNEIKEAEKFVRKVLDPIYVKSDKDNYDWLIKSILNYPFLNKIKIPDIDIEDDDFLLKHECPNELLYTKIKYIKEKIYPHRDGKDYLADLFVNCTQNLNGMKRLKKHILMNNI